MVDFRYHLVSLISVFLALSVGIILGAGPLQNSIGEALTGQVSALRADNANLKQENDQLATRAEAQDKAFASLAPDMLGDSMKDRVVAIVRTADVPDATLNAITDSLKLTGATMGTSVTLTTVWTDPAQAAYREPFAQQISSYVADVDPEADTNTILVAALNQLVRVGADDENNATLLELLSKSDTPLLNMSGELSPAADAVLLLTPDLEAPAVTEDKNADAQAAAAVKNDRDLYVKIATAFAQSGPTVVAGNANTAEDAVRMLREVGGKASLVDTPDTALGSLNVALALGHAIIGEQVDYGTESSAGAAIGTRVEAAKAQEAAAEEAAQGQDAEAEAAGQ